MRKRQMKLSHLWLSIGLLVAFPVEFANAEESLEIIDFPGDDLSEGSDLGPADFGEVEAGMPSSYHDAWCRQLHKECRVTFSGRSMRVDNYKGITREQLQGFRTAQDGGERYFYVRYLNSKGKITNALFLFVHDKAATEFGYALGRWYEQDPRPVPNLRYPNSQGPQDTHGRDGGMNPYDQVGE